jgi:ABC-2 type transport system ATP-binding protein
MRDWAIETANLRKTFGEKVAVRGLTLQVARGEVFGFLGPNGAGKSTSVKMLLGLVAPSAGAAALLGRPLGNRAVRARVGFLPEHFRFHEWLSGEEFLDFHGRLYGMAAERRRKRVPELLALAGLADHGRKRLRDYSKGMLQRIGLVQTLLNEPELILLDEPTSGLDPAGRLLVRDVIRAERDRGASVFLNSHLLSEVEVTCDRVAFIKHGEVLETHDLRTLGVEERRIEARVKGLRPEALEGLRRWADAVRLEGEELSLEVRAEDSVPEVAAYLVASGARLYSLHARQASLEEMFLHIVGTEGGL